MDKIATIKVAPGGHREATVAPVRLPDGLSDAVCLALHQRLAGTLNTSKLMSVFCAWLRSVVPVAGLEYVYPEEGLRVAAGEVGRHKAHYVLRLDQRYLGEVTIAGMHRMTDEMLTLQEDALGILVTYVRNALDYLLLEKVAFHDALTGAMNRTALDELLPKENDRAQRHGYELSVAMIDVDHFKSVNDGLGHLGADEVLHEVAKCIGQKLRRTDMMFRYGGDEFLVLLPNTDLAGAKKVAAGIRGSVAVDNSATIAPGNTLPSVSVGVAARRPGENARELLARADASLYKAKSLGRDRVC